MISSPITRPISSLCANTLRGTTGNGSCILLYEGKGRSLKTDMHTKQSHEICIKKTTDIISSEITKLISVQLNEKRQL